ncbi:MAG TPA: hypothetical protein VF544_22385 [Pyrinomonadaceae bacterium]|jgi:hypothetical protein
MTGIREILHQPPADSQDATVRSNAKTAKVIVACIFATSLLLAAISTSWLSGFIVPLVIIAGIVILFSAWRNWEFGVQAVLVIVIFEGAVRKWLLPSASEFVYFYKDVVMIVSILSYLSRRNKPLLLIKERIKPFLITVAALLVYAVASISNPRAPHQLIGLFGLKVYCLYIPLAFMVPRMFPSKEKLIGFLQWYLLLTLPVIVIGVMQFRNADATSSLNRYAWNQEASESGIEGSGIAAFEDSEGNTYVRVTSTFSYISGLAVYLPVVFALLLGFTSANLSRRSPRTLHWFSYFSLAAVVATAFMTGSRSTLVSFITITLIFYAFTSLKNLKDRLLQVGFGCGLAYMALILLFPQALDAMKTRALGGEEQIEEGRGRIASLFDLPIDEAAVAGPFGFGIGATQNAVPSLMNGLNLTFQGERIPIGYEVESARVMLDLGVVGYLLYFLLRFTLFAILWRGCLSIKDHASKSLAIAVMSVLTVFLFIGGAVINHTQNVYQWFLVGVCLALLNAEKLQQVEHSLSHTALNRLANLSTTPVTPLS